MTLKSLAISTVGFASDGWASFYVVLWSNFTSSILKLYRPMTIVSK